MLKPCRECRREVSDQAWSCPHCRTLCPTRSQWDGWGIEYKSRAALMGLPLVHVSFIAQIGVYIHEGRGQIVRSLEEIFKLLM